MLWTRQDMPFTWDTPQAQAFEALQSTLQAPPVLAHLDENTDTEIHTDASATGLGAIQVQIHGSQERVIT